MVWLIARVAVETLLTNAEKLIQISVQLLKFIKLMLIRFYWFC